MKTATLSRKVVKNEVKSAPRDEELNQREKKLNTAKKMWDSVPEQHRWLEGERVNYYEVRWGPQNHLRAVCSENPSIPFKDALAQFMFQNHKAKMGIMRLDSGARVIFKRRKGSRDLTFHKVQIPLEGRKLKPLFSIEVYDFD